MRGAIDNRRVFLRCMTAGALCGLGATSIHAKDEPSRALGAGKAKSVIFLFLSGGPAQVDTFDVKEAAEVSLVRPIATSVAGVQVSELFPHFSKHAHDAALIRTITTPIPDHALGRYYTHTGYPLTPGLEHPSIGAVCAKELTREGATLSGFVQIGPVFGNVKGDEAVSRYSFYGAGYLGSRYQPLVVRDPVKAVQDLQPAVTSERFQRRIDLLRDLQSPFTASRRSELTDAQLVAVERSVELMNSRDIAAFDLSKDSPAAHEAYGSSPLGDACRLARRLVEVGVPFIEVGMTGWDTHGEHLARHRSLCSWLDPALAALIADLKSRGLLETTLIAVIGEMGRSLPGLKDKAGSNHWGKAGIAVLAGGGVQGGSIIGQTDAKGQEVVARPVTVQDFHATIYMALGIDYTKEYIGPGNRPLPIVDDLTAPETQPIRELF